MRSCNFDALAKSNLRFVKLGRMNLFNLAKKENNCFFMIHTKIQKTHRSSVSFLDKDFVREFIF